MITIFTTLKPITKNTKLGQENSISSWKSLDKNIEIIVFGSEKGVSTLCRDYKIRQYKSIRINKSKLPYVSDLFKSAQKIAKHDIIMYANADMIFTKDLLETINVVKKTFKKFLIVGRRTNLKINKKINFNHPQKVLELLGKANHEGVLFDHTGIDYFIFNKNLFKKIPDLYIGRNGWDNWMVAEGKMLSNTLIDATRSITAIHQNHDYSNISKVGRKTKLYSKETQRNLDLAKGQFASILDANYKIINNKIVKNPQWKINLDKQINLLFRKVDRKLKEKFKRGLSPSQIEVY